MAKAQFFNRRPGDGLLHTAEVNAARLLSKQVAASRQRTPVGNRKSTTKALAVPGAPAPASSVSISTANPVAETVGGAAAPGTTGQAADAGHVHAAAIGTPVAVGNTNAAGASGNFADAAHVHALGGTVGGDLSGTVPNPTVAAIHETSGPTQLTIGTITDGQFLKRVGSTLVSATPGGGGINPTGYIDGCLLSFVSTTSVQVGTGSAYSVNGAALLSVTSPITFAYAPISVVDLAIDASNNKLVSSSTHSFTAADVGMEVNETSGTNFTVQHNPIVSVSGGKATLNLAAGTVGATGGHATIQMQASKFYYVCLASNSTVSVSPTAPTNYQGTSWEDASNNRYVGCFLTTSTNTITNFYRQCDQVYYLTNIAIAPFQVLNGGVAVVATSQSCSTIVPPTSRVMLSQITFNDLGVPPTGAIGTSDVVPTTTTGLLILGPVTGGVVSWKGPGEILLNSSQAFQYILGSGSSNVFVWCRGYTEPR